MKLVAVTALLAGLVIAIENFTAHDIQLRNGQTRYYEGGCDDDCCTPLIFVHGWPDQAESWKHQLSYFAGSQYRIIVPDMRGFGDSSAPQGKSAYTLEALDQDLIKLTEALNITKAVWVAHDWGVGAVNALASHHPELFIGYALLSVPYRTVELGLDSLKPFINRAIYPTDKSEWGQFDYMEYYNLHGENVTKMFDTYYEKLTNYVYLRSDPSSWGKPFPLSHIQKDGGWFGGHAELLPPLPINMTILDQSLHDTLVAGFKKNGFHGATAYYQNSVANAQYAKSERNGGVLDFPLLYIDARLDGVCSPSTSPLLVENQKKFVNVEKFTYQTIEAGHWVHIEQPDKTNAVLDQWLQGLKL